MKVMAAIRFIMDVLLNADGFVDVFVNDANMISN